MSECTIQIVCLLFSRPPTEQVFIERFDGNMIFEETKNLVNAFKTLNSWCFPKWPSDAAHNWKSIK